MPIPNNIKAVIFDLDGTLRRNQPDSTHFFLDTAVAVGAADSPEKRRHVIRWTHYYWAQSPELSQDMQIYPNLTGDFWAQYTHRSLVEFGCSEDQALDLTPALYASMEANYHPEDIVPCDVIPTLNLLAEAGYLLGLLSNRTDPFKDYIQEIGLDGKFQLVLAAGEVDRWKPDPAVFKYFLNQIEVAPEQAVYVGDNYYADILGARNAGLTPILIDPQGVFEGAGCSVITTIADLQALLIPSNA